MSLKAKIEAVIYASEEPVTLAQLAGLLGHEAQAELDHLDVTQRALALEEAGLDEDELNSEVLSDAPQSETEAQHAEALQRHLHDAAAEEAAHARIARLRTAAATAAMSSADSVEPFLAVFGAEPSAAETKSEAPPETASAETLTSLSPTTPVPTGASKFARSPAVIAWPPSLSITTPFAAS